jgi:CarboxypepD_reg-like domain
MKKLPVLILFILLPLRGAGGLFAQTLTQTVRGTVLDKDAQTPLVGVSIKHESSGKGAITDRQGRFRLDGIPVGRQSFKISLMGFEQVSITNQEMTSTKERILNIEMKEAVMDLGEVKIIAPKERAMPLNEMATVSARQFSVEDATRYAGSRNEPARMASNFAGVSGGSDARNDIVVRGNSPVGLLWRYEGLDIPSPNHFGGIGSVGGVVSMLNYNVLANSDFLTGAFPADYGNALSGVFDLKMRHGNDEKHEGLFMMGTIGPEITLEGPISRKNKSSYLVNYRYSTIRFVTQALKINVGFAGNPIYQDGSFKFRFPTKNFGVFTIFGMGGTNQYALNAIDAKADGFDVFLTDNTNQQYNNRLGVVGMSNKIQLTDQTYLQTTVGITATDGTRAVDSVSTLNPTIITPYQHIDGGQTKYLFHSFLSTKFNALHRIKVGLMVDSYKFRHYQGDFDHQSQQLATVRDTDQKMQLLRGYALWQWRPTQHLTINSGVYGQYFDLNQGTSIEPRLGLRYQISERQTLSLAFGAHSQIQNLPTYFVLSKSAKEPISMTASNLNLAMNKAQHWVLGYDFLVSSLLRFKIEMYYQSLYNIPVQRFPSSFSMINEGGDFVLLVAPNLVSEGKAQNIGLEFTAERFFNKGFYFLGTVSLFDSKYQPSNGRTYNTRFNSNYIFNVLCGKEWKVGQNNKFVIDLKATYAGGRRFTPIDLAASKLAGIAIPVDNQDFTFQNPTFFKMDGKVSFRMNRSKLSHEVFLAADNMLNNKNIFGQHYSAAAGHIITVHQLAFLPYFQYRVEF